MSAGLQDQSKSSQGQSPAAAAQVCPGSIESDDKLNLENAFKKNQGHPRLAQWSRILLQTYIFVPMAILTLEAFFSIAGIGQGEIVQPDAQLGCKHIADKLVTWRLEGYSHDRLNSVGMRDVEHTPTKPAAIKRLAFLGDSYTEGLQVPLQETFARRLQTILNTGPRPDLTTDLKTEQQYETLNFGCSSYSTGQELLQFNQQVAAYKPDLVVLLYTPGDSLENSVLPSKRAQAEARPYFYLDAKNQLQQDNGVLALNHDKLKSRPLREFLRAHSTIFGAYNQTNLSLSMSDKVYFRTTRLLSQIVSQVSSKISALLPKSIRNGGPEAGLIPPTWVEPDQLAVSEAIIKKLGQDVKAAGGRLVVMTYPDLSRADPLYVGARSRFAKLAEAEGFGYLDLTAAFSRVKDPNSLFLKVHFSKAGHDLTAQTLSAYLTNAGYLPH